MLHDKTEKIELFEYDKKNHKIRYSKAYEKYLSVSPSTLFEKADAITSDNAYTIELSEVQPSFDRNASLNSLMGRAREKKGRIQYPQNREIPFP